MKLSDTRTLPTNFGLGTNKQDKAPFTLVVKEFKLTRLPSIGYSWLFEEKKRKLEPFLESMRGHWRIFVMIP